MTPLHYRISMPNGSSITASTEDAKLSRACFDITAAHVAFIFKELRWPLRNTEGDEWVPEVLSAATVARIEALEAALENCRDAMADGGPPDGSPDEIAGWVEALDRANELVG